AGAGRAAEVDRQLAQAAEHRVAVPDQLVRLDGEPQAGPALRQLAEDDLPLQARERVAEAEVGAEAEREVAVRLARDVEAVRVGELLGIAVGGAEREDHRLALPHLLAAELDVRLGELEQELDRRVVAEQLLDRALHQAGVLAEALP